MITKHDNKLDNILQANAGVLMTRDASAAGVSRTVLSDYVKRHELCRVSRGVYVDEYNFPDRMLALQKRFPKAIYSHLSALYLHDLTDREPSPLTVSVSSKYNASGLANQGVKIFYINPRWYSLGIEEVEGPTGVLLKTYDKERTMCDLIRRRKVMDTDLFRQAIRTYSASDSRNLTRLSRYAKAMNMETAVRDIVEVAF